MRKPSSLLWLKALIWAMPFSILLYSCSDSDDSSEEVITSPNDSAETAITSPDDLKYQPCSTSKYQGNMTMIAIVKRSEEVLTDCQVAVLDKNGECRACTNSSIKDGGLFFLTIQGEGEGEVLTFHVIYQTGNQLVDVVANERYTYVNDRIEGAFESPYVLTIP